MQGKIVAPHRNKQWDSSIGIGGEHTFVGDSHRMDQLGLHSFDKSAQSFRCA